MGKEAKERKGQFEWKPLATEEIKGKTEPGGNFG
ncbi:hypothetical protein COLO4_18273 [Corchorus olitorius]|uniref:Uncharacterized protein n=1 Tax=Corchorus olitorius TaxID=93759 RepID=A0A1R3J9W4_9ROSI|nr:hypothetical protein COLO4_18273 [Corchorus olitorius]